MTGFLSWSTATYGVLACALAVLIAVYFTLAPGRVRLAAARRRPMAGPTVSTLTQATGGVTTLIDRLLRRSNTEVHVAVLERAGVTKRLQDFVLLVVAADLVAAAVGLVLAGPVLGSGAGAGGPARRPGRPRRDGRPSTGSVRRPVGRLAPADREQPARWSQPAPGPRLGGPRGRATHLGGVRPNHQRDSCGPATQRLAGRDGGPDAE